MRRLWFVALWLAACSLDPTVHADLDGDGWCAAPDAIFDLRDHVCLDGRFGDCDDGDPGVFPGAPEACNGVDDDCSGTVPVAERDLDDDGVAACADDCDDEDPAVRPGAAELCNDRDDDCDGFTDEDLFVDVDQDGVAGPGTCGPTPDCDDADPDVFPGAPEACNDRDDDCDGEVDEDGASRVVWRDADGDGAGDAAFPSEACALPDGFAATDDDCDDTDADRHPAATELCDEVDQDCDGAVDEGLPTRDWFVDGDGDGFGSGAPQPSCMDRAPLATIDGDCDDADAARHPGAVEQCDDVDHDCDGDPLAGVPTSDWWPDADGDGFGDAQSNAPVVTCEVLDGHARVQGDCDDRRADVYPGADEHCDGVDEDCDGTPDDAVVFRDWWLDEDGDGFGVGLAQQRCEALDATHATAGGDCDDDDPEVFPGATERCNDRDDDCDSIPDDGVVPPDWFADGDGDGHGDPALRVTGCEPPHGFVATDDDCDDLDPDVHPGHAEVCNLVDDDCDGVVDDGWVTAPLFPDDDGDGFGTLLQTPPVGCVELDGWSTRADDCDDTSDAVRPGVAEICNQIDDDCDGDADEQLATLTWYPDVDGDGAGDPAGAFEACGDPSTGAVAWVLLAGDCDDREAAVRPGAPEICNGRDDDCDNRTDDGHATQAWWPDVDGDGAGDRSVSPTLTCEDLSATHSDNGLDCDDFDPARHPGAIEACDGVDSDCDGVLDNGHPRDPWWPDADGDGFGAPGVPVFDCATPAGHVGNPDDCDDTDAEVHPDAVERCDAVDHDCDGLPDNDIAVLDWYLDDDGDGFGDGGVQRTCDDLAATHALTDGDCDDADPEVFPGADEVCNGSDDDCNGVDDDLADLPEWFPDYDGDGFGQWTDTPLRACQAAPPWVSDPTDCDDGDPLVFPRAVERCNVRDDDCDDVVDDGLPLAEVYADDDGDGWGRDEEGRWGCASAADFSIDPGDCDDADPAVHPGATELCNHDDDNCNGLVDEDAGAQPAWFDRDLDGWGDPFDGPHAACPQDLAGQPLATRAGDCDDSDDHAHPGAVESCDGLEDDCDDATAPSCARFTTFRWSVWRGPSLQDLDRIDADETTCPSDTDTWMSPWYGLQPDGTEVPGGVTFVDGTKLYLQWDTADAAFVAFPELGVFDLPPSGSLALNGWFDLDLDGIAMSSDGQDVRHVALDPVDYPFTMDPQCARVPLPRGLFPGSSATTPIAPARSLQCGLDAFTDHPQCESCAAPADGNPGWALGSDQAAFSSASGPYPGVGASHVVHGWPVLLPADADIWTRSLVRTDGRLTGQVEVAFGPSHEDACSAAGGAVPATPVLPDGDFHAVDWHHGRADETRSPWSRRRILTPMAWARPTLRVDDAGGETGLALFEDLELWCCGAGCGRCIDLDGDGHGPWCGAQDWDCDDTDPLAYPGAPGGSDCNAGSWWAQTCGIGPLPPPP